MQAYLEFRTILNKIASRLWGDFPNIIHNLSNFVAFVGEFYRYCYFITQHEPTP